MSSPGFNKVILMGNLTRDPELRYTPKGTPVANIGLAVNRTWKDESGQQKEEVTFVDISAWGRTAENASQYLKKGRPILVEGRLKMDTWDDRQTNQKRSKLTVVAEIIQYLGSAPDQSGAQEQGREFNRPAFNTRLRSGRTDTAPPPPADDYPPDAEDDVPF